MCAPINYDLTNLDIFEDTEVYIPNLTHVWIFQDIEHYGSFWKNLKVIPSNNEKIRLKLKNLKVIPFNNEKIRLCTDMDMGGMPPGPGPMFVLGGGPLGPML